MLLSRLLRHSLLRAQFLSFLNGILYIFDNTLADIILRQKVFEETSNILKILSIITPRKIDKLYFRINKIVFKTANVFDLTDHHQV